MRARLFLLAHGRSGDKGDMANIGVIARRDEWYEFLCRELIGLVLTGPPGATGYAGGRPRASQLSAIWSGLVPRSRIHPRAEVLTTEALTTES